MKGTRLSVAGLMAGATLFFGASALGQCNDYQLSITGVCPGIVTLFWGGAPPSAMQGIVRGNVAGCATPLSAGPCAGTTLCMCGGLTLVAIIPTGPAGAGSISGTASTGVCGKPVQMITNFGSPCKVSNDVLIP